MERIKNIFLTMLCLTLSVFVTGVPQALAHTNDTDYGRVPITWPDLGHEGGATLHSKIVTSITKLSDNLLGRWSGDVVLANTASTTITHNLNLALAKLKVLIFEGGVQLTAAQVTAGYVIAQVSVNAYTVQNVTGSSKTIQVITLAFNPGITNADVDTGAAIAGTKLANTPSGNLAATDVQGALNELQTDVDTRATSSALTSHSGSTTGIHGVSGSVVGTTDTQGVSNKTITASNFTGGTASSSQYIVLPSATLATLQGLSRTAGKLYYATDTTLVYYDNGSVLSPVGSGSGSGSKNYITNDGVETDLTGYATYADAADTTPVDGTGGSATTLTATRTTTGAEVLDATASYKLVKSAANGQGQGFSYDFVIDNGYTAAPQQIYALVNTNSTNYVAGDIVACLYDKDTTQLIPIAGASVGNCVPIAKADKQQVRINFNPYVTTSVNYRLIFHVSTVNALTYTAFFDKLTVTPLVLPVGPVVSDIESIPYSAANFTSNSGTWNVDIGDVNNYQYQRVGHQMILEVALSSINVTGTVSELYLKVPGNKTIGTSTRTFSTYSDNGTATPVLVRAIATESVLRITKLSGGNFSTVANNSDFMFQFTFPIAEWSGSANIVNGPNIECATNTSTATAADDTTSFSNDCGGSLLRNITAALKRRVRWQYAMQPGDQYLVQLSSDRIKWLTVSGERQLISNTYNFCSYKDQANTTYGIGRLSDVNSTDMDLYFGTYATDAGGAYGAAGGSWTAQGGTSVYYRVLKLSGVAANAYAEAVPGISAGFLSQNGVRGSTDNSNATAGYVGEVIAASASSVACTSTATTMTSITLTAGDWDVSASGLIVSASGSSDYWILGVNTTTNSISGLTNGTTLMYGTYQTGTSNVANSTNISPLQIKTPGVYYLICKSGTGAMSTGNFHGTIRARRMR